MTTPKQSAANRRNAKKSTGPKTAAGRARSSTNARTHGLTAASPFTIFDEVPEAFFQYHGDLITTLLPVGRLELDEVRWIAFAGWRLRLVYRIEKYLYDSARVAASREYGKSQWAEARGEEEDLLTSAGKALSEEDTAFLRESIRKRKEIAYNSMNFYREQECEGIGRIDIGSIFQRLTMSDPISALLRYKANIERSYYRAQKNLARLQALRKGVP
jgi:hypothetical protein